MPRGRPCKCPYEGCGSTNTVSKGVRLTKTLGIRKIRRCKSCGRKFTPKNQKLIPVEGDQANEAQTESVNEEPSEDLASKESDDSAARAQDEPAETTEQSEAAPDEPGKPQPADPAMMASTQSEPFADGH